MSDVREAATAAVWHLLSVLLLVALGFMLGHRWANWPLDKPPCGCDDCDDCGGDGDLEGDGDGDLEGGDGGG